MQALFVDNLTVIDFAYFHPQRGIVGESLILDVELFGELNDEGMLFDFSFVKKRIKSCVDNLVDHKFLVATRQTGVHIEETPQHLKLDLTTSRAEHYTHVSPHQAVYLVDADQVSGEMIAQSIHAEIQKILPHNVTQLKLQLRPEEIKGHYYHYAHGLKKHYGDCQRIAHGHRSKIEVWVDNDYSEKWSKFIANAWKDIYLATEEDLVETISIDNKEYFVFQYHANQGLFQLTMPSARCLMIPTDTTVELIASYLVAQIKQQSGANQVKVKAYEGLDKGAIALL